MSIHLSPPVQDLALRTGGLVAFAAGAAALVALYRLAHIGRLHPPTLMEIALAAIAVCCLLGGAGLVVQGRGLLAQDPVPTSRHDPIVQSCRGRVL